ncbi:hypothetical protein [Meridianimarinicoccus aquatilis]|uniref:Uncharacterized protein n=1 Tax=Meridianimarinicoccus aquatilis TaxID=2552766 RepID=A0A4R6APD3_9RHOB|nr:hypothetical protein [Fluviibacterium aquatile]TDL83493.1 hypothetical protein E2L05_19465 [Fluviibacterium aquatile]
MLGVPALPVPAPDLEVLIADAVTRAITARATLRNEIIPTLPPKERSFAQHLANTLHGERLFDTAVRTDLETFVARVEDVIQRGTVSTYILDTSPECMTPTGGWTETVQTPEAAALTVAIADLRDLLRAITAVQARVIAQRLGADLFAQR